MKYTALVTYYSRSGNTVHFGQIAEAALNNCGWEVVRMPIDRAVKAYPSKAPELIIIGTPVHFWAIPSAVLDYIRRMPGMQGSYAFVFSCYGGCVTSNVPFDLAKAVSEKGAVVIGGAQFLAPHSTRIDGKQRLGDIDEKFGKGFPDEKTTTGFSDAIKHMTRLIESGSIEAVDKEKLKMNTMGFWASAAKPIVPVEMRRKCMPPVSVNQFACNGCGACVQICDTGSIYLGENNKALINQGSCYRCHGCLEVCPNGALATRWKQAEILVRTNQWISKNMDPSVIVLPNFR